MVARYTCQTKSSYYRTMNKLEKLNSAITNEANSILHDYGLLRILNEYGKPVVTGSFVLGLMTWRDLDIYLEIDDMTIERFFHLGNELALNLKPHRMSFRNEVLGRTPGLPVGLYWGIYTNDLDLPEEWKIDIWAIDTDQITAFTRELEDLSRIDEETRAAILTIKNHFCRHPEYRRSFISMDIYHGVIEHGIRSVGEFSKWLKDHRGISS